MKKLFTLFICLLTASIYSQEQKPVLRGGYGIYFGAGALIPGSEMKENNNMGNLTTFKVGGFVPLFDFARRNTFGLNAGVAYFTGNRDYSLGTYQPYNITGQTGLPDIAAKGSGSPRQAGFKTEAGAQANFNFGRYTLSPVLNLAYINLKQKEFSVVQSSAVNGQNYDYDLYRQAESKTSGVGAVAGISHRYRFGRDWRFSIYAETHYNFGPSVTAESSALSPEGVANAQGNYNLNQLNSATRTVQTKNTKFNAFGASIGFGVELGRIGRIVITAPKKNTTVNRVERKARKAAKKASKRPNSTHAYAIPVEDSTSTSTQPQHKRIHTPLTLTMHLGASRKIAAQETDNPSTGTGNSNPQNMIFGGPGLPVKICMRLFDGNGHEIVNNGFINLMNVATFAYLPCSTNPAVFATLDSCCKIDPRNTKTHFVTLNFPATENLNGKVIELKEDFAFNNEIIKANNVKSLVTKAGKYTFDKNNSIQIPLDVK